MLDRILELCNTIQLEEEGLNNKRREAAKEINRLLKKCYLMRGEDQVIHVDEIEVVGDGIDVYGLSINGRGSIEDCITYIPFSELGSNWKLCELRRFKEAWDHVHEMFYEKLPKGFKESVNLC